MRKKEYYIAVTILQFISSELFTPFYWYTHIFALNTYFHENI